MRINSYMRIVDERERRRGSWKVITAIAPCNQVKFTARINKELKQSLSSGQVAQEFQRK